jgi:hypothetical protein
MLEKIWRESAGWASGFLAVGSVVTYFASDHQSAIYIVLLAIYCQLVKSLPIKTDQK